MSQGRSSLLSDSGFDAIGKKGAKDGSSGGPSKLDTTGMVKIGVGAVALLAGVFLIMKSLGVFEPNPYGATLPEAEAQRIEEQRAAEQKQFLEMNKNITVGGA